MMKMAGRPGSPLREKDIMAAPRHRYTAVAIVLHWIIAAAILFQIGLGWRMGAAKGVAAFEAFQLHKSIGIVILILSVARLGWRLGHRAPVKAGQPRWEKAASHAVHGLFYVIMIGLPLTGWAIVSTSRIDIPTLLFQTVPWPHIPWLHDLSPATRMAWNDAAMIGHGALVYLTLALLLLHLGAVAKHHFLDRDGVLGHMVPVARPIWSDPWLWGIGIAAALVLAIGRGLILAPAPAPVAAAPVAPVVAPVSSPVPPTVTATTTPAALPSPTPTSAPTDAATAPQPPVRWSVAKGSTLGFVASWSGQGIDGRFARWDADILFSPDALAGSHVRVTIDLASASSGDVQRDASLAGSDWFDTATHPKAVFEASQFERVADGRYKARGTLTLRGVKKPLTLPFSLTIKGDRATMRGEATLNRNDFGVGQGEWASTDQIPASVRVPVSIVATRE